MKFDWKTLGLSHLFGSKRGRKPEPPAPPPIEEIIGKDCKIVNGGVQDSGAFSDPGDCYALIGIVDGQNRAILLALDEITGLFIANIKKAHHAFAIEIMRVENGLARFCNWGSDKTAHNRPTRSIMEYALQETISQLEEKYGIPVIDKETYEARQDISRDKRLIQGDGDVFVQADGSLHFRND
ncbi:MAG: hypothetical protein GC137_10275 [Alphaproteobacteria bacterium]|nr:hypothetical protein [Alphaproteobacteria bacterium]